MITVAVHHVFPDLYLDPCEDNETTFFSLNLDSQYIEKKKEDIELDDFVKISTVFYFFSLCFLF